MGRRPLPEDEKRTNILRIPLLEAERSEIDALAQETGLPSATWARAVLLRELNKSAKPRRTRRPR